VRPDEDSTRDFLVRLHGRATAGKIEMIRLGTGGIKAELFLPENIDLAAARAAEWNAVEGANIYFGASLKRPGTFPHSRTSDIDFFEAWALHIDLDAPGAVNAALGKATMLGIPPTLVVITGTQPHPRAHFWWLLEEPIRDAGEYRAALKLLAAVFGGDPTVTNPGRIMRLPGMIAWPTKEGRRQELVTWAEASGRVYLPGEIQKACGAPITPPETPQIRPQITPDITLITADITPPITPPITPQTIKHRGVVNSPDSSRIYTTNSLGLQDKLLDGREAYMRDTVLAVAIELAGALERWPTGPEIAEAAWSQYEANVDLSRPGRGRDELEAKAAYLAQRLPTGAVEGAPGLAQAIGRYRDQQQAKARVEAPQAPKHSRLSPHSPGNGEWKWDDEPPLPAPIAALPAMPGIEPNFDLDLANIPPRQWIYGRHLVAGYVSALVARGGAGKTALSLVEAVAIATGRPLLGEQVHETGRVWHYNLEDPREDIRRRVLAILKHYQIDEREIAGRLAINSARDRELIVARRLPGRLGGLIMTPDVDAVIANMRANEIKLLTVDPFVHSHHLSENDNAEVAFVMKAYAHIAAQCHAAILLIHHDRKPATGFSHDAGDINTARGASAFAGAVRAARTLATMSADDAAKLGVPEELRRFLVRVDDAKANLSPPREHAVWLRLHSVDLENHVGLRESDKVGVLVPWAPEKTEAILAPADRDAVLAEIDRAYIAGNGYSPRNQAGYGRRYSLAFERAMPGRAPSEHMQRIIVEKWLESRAPWLIVERSKARTEHYKAGSTILRVQWENVETTAEDGE